MLFKTSYPFWVTKNKIKVNWKFLDAFVIFLDFSKFPDINRLSLNETTLHTSPVGR